MAVLIWFWKSSAVVRPGKTRPCCEIYITVLVWRSIGFVSALGDTLDFQILCNTPDGFLQIASTEGWVRSDVFSREFYLDRVRDRLGMWRYVLQARNA